MRLSVPEVGSCDVDPSLLLLSAHAAAHLERFCLQKEGEVRWCTYDRAGTTPCRYGAECHFAHVSDDGRGD
eukprot:gene7772-792_t